MAQRFDTVAAPAWLYSKMEKTPEGYMKGKAVVCTTGVYEYQKADGSVIKELRLPEEVFAEAFIDSLRLKPLTLGHPVEMVTADNIRDYQVGTLGETIIGDAYHVAVEMVITDPAAIKAVEAGTRELSVGYTCDLEPAEPGARWFGQSYDYVQRNIRANHTSLVDKARAGDAAKLRLDSADAVMVHPAEVVEANNDSIGGIIMPELKTVKIDGVEYQGEAKILETLNTAQVKADTLQTALDALTAEKSVLEADRDTMKDKVDGLEAKVKELEERKVDQAMIDAAVARRVKIMDAARLAEVEVADGMAELEIQKAVIMKVFPKAVLDGRDAAYVDARFDGAVEMLSVKAEEKADADVRELGNPEHVDSVDAVEAVNSVKAREKMIADLKTRYLGSKK